ncbi:hypothetical protein QOT17_017721 [Balamuthia mandrillaris]
MRSKAVCVGLVICGAFLSWLVAGEIDWKTQTCSEKQLRDGSAKACYRFCDHWKFIDQHLYKTCITNTVPPCLGCRPATKQMDEPPSYIEQCTQFAGLSCSFFEVSDSAMNASTILQCGICTRRRVAKPQMAFCTVLVLLGVSAFPVGVDTIVKPVTSSRLLASARSMEYCHNDTRYVGGCAENTIIQAQPMRYGEGELYFSYPDYYADYYHVVYRAIISSTISLNASFEMGGRELEADEFHEPIEIYFQASRDVQKGERACVAYFDEGLSAWVCLDDTTLASGDTSPQVYCGVTHHFTNFALLIGTMPDKEDGNDGYDESGFDSSSEVGSESVSGAVLLPPGQLW